MAKAKRIFVIADFKDESPKSIRMQQRMWVKGLLRIGCDVHRFSYRNLMMQFNPFSSKRFVPRFTRGRVDNLLVQEVKLYQPNVVFILGMKYLTAETVRAIRRAAANAIIVGRDDDPFPEKNTSRLEIARETDMVVTTGGGRFLKTYKDFSVPRCAFLPNMCDPDLQYRYNVEERWKTDIIFTGKTEHTRLTRNNDRYELIHKLSTMPNATLYGCLGQPRVEGIHLFFALSGAKVGLSINIANDVRLYHSDRFINYLSCGTFVLAKRVPDSDLLFEDGVHVRYFDTADEFFELADWYLQHEQEREKIAMEGMERAHREFNCERIAKYMLDIIETGNYDTSWAEIL